MPLLQIQFHLNLHHHHFLWIWEIFYWIIFSSATYGKNIKPSYHEAGYSIAALNAQCNSFPLVLLCYVCLPDHPALGAARRIGLIRLTSLRVSASAIDLGSKLKSPPSSSLWCSTNSSMDLADTMLGETFFCLGSGPCWLGMHTDNAILLSSQSPPTAPPSPLPPLSPRPSRRRCSRLRSPRSSSRLHPFRMHQSLGAASH